MNRFSSAASGQSPSSNPYNDALSKSFQGGIADLAMTVNTDKETIIDLQKDRCEDKARLKTLEHEMEERDARICELRRELSGEQVRNQVLQGTVHHMETDKRALRRALRNSERQCSQQDNLIQELKGQVRTLKSDINTTMHTANPLQLRALTDYLLANYGHRFGDPDKRRMIRSACEDLADRTGHTANKLEFLLNVASDEGNKMAHSVSTRALALAIDTVQNRDDRATWDCLFALAMRCDVQEYLDSGLDEDFEVTRARQQGATDIYRPIRGAGRALRRSETTGGLNRQ